MDLAVSWMMHLAVAKISDDGFCSPTVDRHSIRRMMEVAPGPSVKQVPDGTENSLPLPVNFLRLDP